MRRPLSVAILGATGSIGRQALEVIDRFPDRFRLFGLATGSRESGREAPMVVRASQPDADARLEEMVTHPDCDLVLVAISGARALRPSIAALGAKKKLALATKEVLVMAGPLVMRLAAEAGHDAIRPVDSEHSAIWQCLWGERPESVRRLILTASGGPFWSRPGLDLDEVTVEEALSHPRWSMGPKITVDSATLVNKGLELIEGHHLFGIPLEGIDVVVHPQSFVHSLVEFVDGSQKAQLGNPDMRLPIALALSYPDRLPGAVPPSDITAVGRLEFHPLDGARFPAVEVCREAARKGGTHPAVLNAANEEAVAAFLAGNLRFSAIVPTVEAALEAHTGGGEGLAEILEADLWTREWVASKVGKVRK